MDQCLWGCLMSLSARFGVENMERLLVALHDLAQCHRYLDCELVNRQLSESGLDLQVDEPALGLALEALKRAGFVEVEPATVQ